MPLICVYGLFATYLRHNKKVDNVGLAPTNNCLPFFPFIAYSYKVS